MDSFLFKTGLIGFIGCLAATRLPLFGIGEQLGLAGAAVCFGALALWHVHSAER